MDELDRLLNGLGLSDEAQVEYARGILLDEGAEDDEELSEVVKSLIEEPSENFDASFPAVMTKARSLRQQDQAQQAEAAEQAKVRQKEEAERRVREAREALEAEKEAKSKQGLDKKPMISAEERARLLKEYGSVVESEDAALDEGTETASQKANPGNAGGGGKKKKGKQELPSDLLSIVNDNKAKVADAQRLQRETAAKASLAKKAKDKADLEKQRADQEKRKKDAQDRAKKQERRA